MLENTGEIHLNRTTVQRLIQYIRSKYEDKNPRVDADVHAALEYIDITLEFVGKEVRNKYTKKELGTVIKVDKNWNRVQCKHNNALYYHNADEIEVIKK